MIESGLSGVEFIAVNTDAQDLDVKSKAEIKLQIGSKLTNGRGAGGKPAIGEEAAKEDHEAISDNLRGADMVFVTACLGGGTGTGSAPVIAKIAREHGALTVAVVTKPFAHEGTVKMSLAEEGIRKLREAVDTLIVIPNQNIMKIADRKMTYTQAYWKVNEVLRQGVQGISDLITKTGEINTDFADVKATMEGKGDALMGIGIGKGDSDNRAKEAALGAIDNPLLEDTSIEGATRLLINISGPKDIGIIEIDDILDVIGKQADPHAEIIHGLIEDPELNGDIKVTVIATGFPNPNKNAMPAGRPDTYKKAEPEPISDIISIKTWNEMRGQRENREVYGYSGVKQREHNDNLDVPAAWRKYSDTPGDQMGKTAGGRDA
jgi:cell division protein FtsZ